jgi:hypothetical protein
LEPLRNFAGAGGLVGVAGLVVAGAEGVEAEADGAGSVVVAVVGDDAGTTGAGAPCGDDESPAPQPAATVIVTATAAANVRALRTAPP